MQTEYFQKKRIAIGILDSPYFRLRVFVPIFENNLKASLRSSHSVNVGKLLWLYKD